MDKLTIYGIRLRQARIAARLTRQELADVAEVPMVTIWRIETGRVQNPWMRTLLLLARGLGLQLDELAS